METVLQYSAYVPKGESVVSDSKMVRKVRIRMTYLPTSEGAGGQSELEHGQGANWMHLQERR